VRRIQAKEIKVFDAVKIALLLLLLVCVGSKERSINDGSQQDQDQGVHHDCVECASSSGSTRQSCERICVLCSWCPRSLVATDGCSVWLLEFLLNIFLSVVVAITGVACVCISLVFVVSCFLRLL
jgi:hypothetical protein